MRLSLLLVLFTAGTTCIACNCNPEIEEMNMARYNEAAAIFIGHVDSLSDCSQTQAVYFTVKAAYKGNFGNSIAITEIDCKTACSFTFEKGRDYLVYAYNKFGSQLNLIPCTPNRKLLTQKEIETELRLNERYNTSAYILKELTLWKEEIAFLEKMKSFKNGDITITYPNGTPTAKGQLVNGVPVGKWEYFYPDGGVKAVGEYANGKKIGFWVEYNMYYTTYEDTTVHTVRKKYIVKSLGHYQEGLKDGLWERVNLDGSMLKFYYVKGKFDRESD